MDSGHGMHNHSYPVLRTLVCNDQSTGIDVPSLLSLHSTVMSRTTTGYAPIQAELWVYPTAGARGNTSVLKLSFTGVKQFHNSIVTSCGA